MAGKCGLMHQLASPPIERANDRFAKLKLESDELARDSKRLKKKYEWLKITHARMKAYFFAHH